MKNKLVDLIKNKNKSAQELTEYYIKNNISVNFLEKIYNIYGKYQQVEKLKWFLSIIENKEIVSDYYYQYIKEDNINGFKLLMDNQVPYETDKLFKSVIEHSVNTNEILKYMLEKDLIDNQISFYINPYYEVSPQKYLDKLNILMEYNIYPEYPLLSLEKIASLDDLEVLNKYKNKFDLTDKNNLLFDIFLEKEALNSIEYMLDNYKSEYPRFFKILSKYFNCPALEDVHLESNYTSEFQNNLVDLLCTKLGFDKIKEINNSNEYINKRINYLEMLSKLNNNSKNNSKLKKI